MASMMTAKAADFSDRPVGADGHEAAGFINSAPDIRSTDFRCRRHSERSTVRFFVPRDDRHRPIASKPSMSEFMA